MEYTVSEMQAWGVSTEYMLKWGYGYSDEEVAEIMEELSKPLDQTVGH